MRRCGGGNVSHLEKISEARATGAAKLASIAGEHGRESPFWRACRDMWHKWEGEALTSLLYGDLANAEVLLSRGLDILTHAPRLVTDGELPLEDAALLLAAV
jgi:hypothetical protein